MNKYINELFLKWDSKQSVQNKGIKFERTSKDRAAVLAFATKEEDIEVVNAFECACYMQGFEQGARCALFYSESDINGIFNELKKIEALLYDFEGLFARSEEEALKKIEIEFEYIQSKVELLQDCLLKTLECNTTLANSVRNGLKEGAE